eukprot:gene23061-29882_t
MEIDNENALIAVVPDLVDFFNQVDINGDGHMEWSEFVMFVIEQVALENNNTIFEGSYDYNIYGYDIDSIFNDNAKPIFILNKHKSLIQKIIAINDCNRCFTLDKQGNIIYWDISKQISQ